MQERFFPFLFFVCFFFWGVAFGVIKFVRISSILQSLLKSWELYLFVLCGGPPGQFVLGGFIS